MTIDIILTCWRYPVHPPVTLDLLLKVWARSCTVFAIPLVLVDSEGMSSVRAWKIVNSPPNEYRGRAVCNVAEVNKAEKTVRVGGRVGGIVLHLAGGLPRVLISLLKLLSSLISYSHFSLPFDHFPNCWHVICTPTRSSELRERSD